MDQQPNPASPSPTCRSCSRSLEEGWVLCPYCGERTLPPSTTAAIDTYVRSKVDLALSERIKDQSGVVRELADKAEDTVWSRLKRYTVLLVGVVAILAYFGLKPLYDFYAQIKPAVDAAEQRVQAVTQAITQLTGQITPLKAAVDRLSRDEATLSNRVSQRGGEISQKLQSLNQTADEFTRRLTSMEKSFDTRLAQIAQQVDNVSVQQAFPGLGQKMFVIYNGRAWKGKAAKTPGDRWINIQLQSYNIPRFTTDEIDKLMKALRSSGYTPWPGMFGISGPYSTSYGPFGSAGESTVFYFERSSEPMAIDAASIASKVLSTDVKAIFVDPGTQDEPRRFVIENSGIDLQLVLLRPPTAK